MNMSGRKESAVERVSKDRPRGALLRAAVLGMALLGAALLASSLTGCDAAGTRNGAVAGEWEGILGMIRDGRRQEVAMTAELMQSGPHLSGQLSARGARQAGEGFEGRGFEILEGLASEEEVFFFARAFLPTGTATIEFHGQLADQGRTLSGPATVDVSTTGGSALVEGDLTLRRVP